MNKTFLKKLITISTALFFVLVLLTGCGEQAADDVPENTYMPPVNDEGYITVTLPIGSTEEDSTLHDILYFDVSSVSWKDEQYKGFFENLAFEEKTITYSIAVRDEDKEIMVAQRIKLPNEQILLDKIKKAFGEEYGEEVTSSLVSCSALSGSAQETLSGILVQSNECLHLGILVHMASIGKKINIKFYTLFMPINNKLEEQKQQLFSLYKKMSPGVTMWENSLKTTILIALEQLLNEMPASGPVVITGDEVEL